MQGCSGWAIRAPYGGVGAFLASFASLCGAFVGVGCVFSSSHAASWSVGAFVLMVSVALALVAS